MTRPTRCPVLVERDEELRALSRLASETFEYGARTAALTGESGAGKSRLAQDFVASLPEAWTARTVRFTRTGASVPPLAPDRPLALVLDDAHFLDPSAIDDMARLLDGLGSDVVLVLMTFRLGFHRAGSAEMRALARFLRDPRALELRVMPLSADGVAEMAAAMGRYAGEELFRRTGGNAFWAEELLRENERIPWTVVESITAQLEVLPGDARELACALAVAEEPLSARAADALAADVDAAWSALIDAGLAETDGAGIWLRHALVGEAISSRLGPMESERWHGLLAAALEADGADPDRVAHHWAAAGDSRRAAELATGSAPRLREAGAIRRAFTCYELALRHPPEDRRTAAELHEEGALTAARAGEYDAMARWLEEADRCYRAAGQPDRAVRMVLDPTFDYLPVRRSDRIRDEPVERLLLEARQAIRDDDPHAARELIDTAIAAARSRRDGMALGRSARMLALTVGEFERADGLLDAALEYPDVAARPGRQSRILTIRASNLAAQGYTQASLELIQRAVSITRRESEAVYRVGEIALANAMLLVGRVADAASLLRQAGEAMPGAAAVARTADGVRRFEAGDPRGLDVIAEGVDGLIAGLDFDPIGLAVVGGHVLGMRALDEAHGGRAADALRTVARVDALAPEPYNDVAADLAYVLGRAGVALGARAHTVDAMESMVWHSGLPGFVPVPAFIEQEILRAAARFPGRAALCEAGGRRSITFGQLADGSSRLAGGLAELGVGRGDVVSIVAANHPDFPVALYGSLTAGAAVATANPSLTAAELRRLLLLSGPKVVLADTHSISAVSEALAWLGSDARVFMLDGPAGAQPLSALLRSPSPGPERDSGDCALLFPSGGTTGLPKIAVHTHAGATAWLQAFARTQSMCMHATDVVAVVAPFTHMFGSAVAAHALRAGATVVASRAPGFTLETFVQMLADHRVTVTSATPPVALALARHPLVEEFDLSSLRLVILGAAPTSRDIQVELADRLGCQVADCLGSTEAFCYAPAADPIVRGSVGTLGPNMSAVVVDPDRGERVGPDEPGELWIRGPQVMAGYLRDQHETAQVLDRDGWLRTGDLCSIDADGNIYIHDRLKELIKVGGASVAPAEVEQELMAHPAVIDAGVVGRPHPALGEVPVAYVALRGDDGDANELLRGFFDDRLAPWKHPREIVVIDSVPRSANGKLMRRELIERERTEHGPVVAA